MPPGSCTLNDVYDKDTRGTAKLRFSLFCCASSTASSDNAAVRHAVVTRSTANMPLETLFSNPLPAIPPSRSLISRLTSPLGKRNRNIADFSIEPDHPYKAYTPGELVKGNVLLTVAKGFDVTHLVTCLHGYAKVYKNQVVPGEGVVADGILDIRGGNQGVEYRGNGLVSLFQDEVALCGDGFLKKGVYKFGFELEFPPKSLPSSIDVRPTLLLSLFRRAADQTLSSLKEEQFLISFQQHSHAQPALHQPCPVIDA